MLNKHLNGKKISSHMWFFEGFCKLLKPKYCVLIDVGTVPSEDGLVNYFKGMEADEKENKEYGLLYVNSKNVSSKQLVLRNSV